MTFFVDANVLAYAGSDSPWTDACLAVVEAVGAGAAGRTSTAVLEELWHLERSGRAGSFDGLTREAYALFTPLLPVTDEVFGRAMDLDAPRLGTNDRVHVGTCLVNGIDVIVSADAGFDGLRNLRRVDPLDTRALTRLLVRAR